MREVLALPNAEGTGDGPSTTVTALGVDGAIETGIAVLVFVCVAALFVGGMAWLLEKVSGE